MGRTLFVGCSHTMGYREDAPKDQPNVWRDNNYAEIYSQINDKKVAYLQIKKMVKNSKNFQK